jgi:DNA-binding PadR family transcriptional regulator
MPHRSATDGVIPFKPLVFEILLVLAEGERHGYGIVKEVEERTGGELRIEPANLYRTLRGMLSQGLIEESARRPDRALDDQRRRYFRLTGLGRAAAGDEAARLRRQLAVARSHGFISS